MKPKPGPAGAGAMPAEIDARPALDVVPFNAGLEDEARELWLAADWQGLARLAQGAAGHPDQARLLALGVAAALQVGDRRLAQRQLHAARQAGCDRGFLQAVLLASARNTLARASLAAGRDAAARRHFEGALVEVRTSSEARRVAQARIDQVKAELGARRKLGEAQRKAGIAVAAAPPAWLSDLLGQCLAAEDVHEAIDRALALLGPQANERVRFLILVAEHFQGLGDTMTAVHYLNAAAETAPDAAPALRVDLARRLVAAGVANAAMDLLVKDALSHADASIAGTLATAYQRARAAEDARLEHGHELLLSYLQLYLPVLRADVRDRPLQMVEVGTTRENVPGQGSTRKLAEYCRANGIVFTTVDMDPHNSHNAREVFRQLDVAFEAVTSKGEDYLRERREPVDLLFLDAYDFDHGRHSELRQSRYQRFLGARIDEQACHQMHLDCAESAQRLLSPRGLLCIDDTWLENGAWSAKGTTAMPWLLAHGFELIEARNRAALLRRGNPSAS